MFDNEWKEIPIGSVVGWCAHLSDTSELSLGYRPSVAVRGVIFLICAAFSHDARQLEARHSRRIRCYDTFVAQDVFKC